MELNKEFFEQLNPNYVQPEYKFSAHLKAEVIKVDVRAESNDKQHIVDIVSGWIMDHKVDWKNPVIDKENSTTTWEDNTVLITCNFEYNEA